MFERIRSRLTSARLQGDPGVIAQNPVSERGPAGPAQVIPGRFYRPELDGLRFLAFLGVLLNHTMPTDTVSYEASGTPHVVARLLSLFTTSGAYGVDLFFLLSSFLITELLLREHAARGAINAPAFLARRALRIWPLFFTFLLVSAVTDRLFGHRGLSSGYAVAFLAFVGNWACGLFGWPNSSAAPLWSISIEEQFYLCWPFVIASAGPHRLRTLGLSLLAIAALGRIVTVAAGTDYPAVWVLTPGRLDPIGLGVLLVILLRRWPLAPSTLPRIALAGAGVLVWLLASRRFSVVDQSLLSVSVLYPCVAIGAALIFIGAYGARGVLTLRPIIYLGRISYGLYVLHSLAVEIVIRWLGSPERGIGMTLKTFVLTCALAMLSYHALERPFLQLKKRFTVIASREP